MAFRKILCWAYFRVRSALSEILITITFIAANFRLLALYSYTFSVHKLKHYLAHMGAMVCDKDLNFAKLYSLEIPITYSEPKIKTWDNACLL